MAICLHDTFELNYTVLHGNFMSPTSSARDLLKRDVISVFIFELRRDSGESIKGYLAFWTNWKKDEKSMLPYVSKMY